MGRVLIIVLLVGLVAGVAWLALPRIIRPSGNDAPVLRFFVVGDNHGPRLVYKELLTKAKAAGASFVVNLADLTEHGTADELRAVRALEDEAGLPVKHVIGSHDIKSDPTRAVWEREIGPAYQTFAEGDARFILLDNADRTVGFPDKELTWLESTLQSNRSRFTFLFYHRPFGLPLEGLFGDDETPASRKTNSTFRGLLRADPPTMIFTAHVHLYLPYALENIPAYVTGGGGDPTQTLLGGTKSSFFHGLLVTVRDDGPTVEVIKAETQP